MSEYIGSRISLISKSEIKYIGTLHEINSENHTVALENVTSHGTEGRKGNPAEEIPGSDRVYEYIVFRGSDVKELNIVAAPAKEENTRPAMPDDPAILGSARPGPPPQQPQQPPPQQHNQFRGPPPNAYQQPQQFGYPPPPQQFQAQSRFQGPGGPHGFPGSPGAVPGYVGYGPPPGYGMGYGPPLGQQGFQGPPPPGHFPPNNQMLSGPPGQQRPPQHIQQGQPQPPIGSKQNTPQPTTQQASKSPGLESQQPQKPIEMSGTPAPAAVANASPAGPLPLVESKPTQSKALAPPATSQAPQAPPNNTQRTHNNRVALPLPSPNTLAAKPAQRPAQPPQQQSQSTTPAPLQQTVQDATQAATAAVAAAMAKLGTGNRQGQLAATSTDNLTHQLGQMRVHDMQQRGRGRGRGDRGDRGERASRAGRRESGQKAIEVPKEDYDFETANAKFKKEDAHTNGDTTDSAPANGDADDETVIPAATGGAEYNKQKSFFDDISSDLKDRTARIEMVDGRAMRREERSRNMETFGQGSVDGFGGRGGYRGRGVAGRGYRGGFEGRGGRGGRGYAGGRGGSGFEGRGRGAATGEVQIGQASAPMA
ncbi:hypothetical protein LTR62_002492 [Meristemomyces frigidus]|uniref:Uncharacterized protein n=1 Tax=Meristemomyces frigidus TaxID=1508187 RepID=A0AAN7YB33_9PEZI|nr:hypothetical protein LTR62_002492 [Meristemomyces frigidus]